ncbi:uncharacterized protein LOC135154863 [Lytechinus pictus]|uniref:uncharacterized protein LOC135154863 n=1 Tax=Lytechinus pictus TaxID=7653 RepID=UPI0030B9E2E1
MMLSKWKSSQPPGEKAIKTLKCVWESVQSVEKPEHLEEEDTTTVLKQTVVEMTKPNELESDLEKMEIIDFSETDDDPLGPSCEQVVTHEDLDQHGGIPNTEELSSVAHQVKTFQIACSLGKALRIDDISIVGYVTQQNPSSLDATAMQILLMWHDGLEEGVKEVELHELLMKYISGDKTGGYDEIAKLIRSEVDLLGLIRHLGVQPTSVMEIINTSVDFAPHMVVSAALQMLIEWSSKGGIRERLLAIAQAFQLSCADLIAKGLACHSTYPFFISYGIIDHKGQRVTLDELGITVSIPEGAIPKGTRSTVTLRVSIHNTLRLPIHDDEVLITPVLETSVHQELLKPASIVLPHCVKFREQNDDSSVVLYTKTESGMNLVMKIVQFTLVVV